MKFLLVSFFMGLFSFSNGQDSLNCQVLVALLNHKDAQTPFFFNDNDYKHLPIVFIDTKGNFAKCIIAQSNGRQVEIVHDSSYLSKKSVSYIIIESFVASKREYSIRVFQRNTGASARVKLRRIKHEVEISKFELGYF